MEIRKLLLHGKYDLRIEIASIPDELAADQVFVETQVSALSTGTDLGNYLGDSLYVPGAPDYPRSLGYSNAGIVRGIGSQVSRLRVGDRVFSTRPHQSAYIANENDLLTRIPETVSSEQASLAYLTQLGLAAMRQAGYQAGENIVIIGLGVIGLATIALAKAMGANVLGVANSDVRARAALTMGAFGSFLSDKQDLVSSIKGCFHGAEADLVILTSNSWESYFLALEVVRHSGRVSILGFPGRGGPLPERNPLDPSPFYSKQLTLIGAGRSPGDTDTTSIGWAEDVRFNLRRNLEYIFDLMASNRLNITPLISHRIPYQNSVDAYELARRHAKELVAAVFEWSCGQSQ